MRIIRKNYSREYLCTKLREMEEFLAQWPENRMITVYLCKNGGMS